MRTIEVGSFGTSISLEGSLLCIRTQEGCARTIPIDDLDLVVLQVPAVSVTGAALAALAALAASGVSAMICNGTHTPVGWLHPVGADIVHDPDRARRQAGLPERTRSRLWRAIVRSKVAGQAEVLRCAGKPHARLVRLADEVEAGDPTNVEALAAQIYWPALFGTDFRRRGDTWMVAALDWGYAVLRAIVCRALVAAGLHPGIGLHHRAAGNGFNLADDLIEPYRPVVDRLLWEAWRTDPGSEAAVWKPLLVGVGERPVEMESQLMRCRAAVATTVASLVRIIDAGKGTLLLPAAAKGNGRAGRLAEDVAPRLL